MSYQQFYDKKSLVIVGFSYAGWAILQELYDKFHITIIDKNEYFDFSLLNASHLAIDPKYQEEQKMFYKYQDIQKNYKYRFSFIQGLLQKVNKDNSIDVKENLEITKIKFDFLVICTGCSYDTPFRSQKTQILERIQEIEIQKNQIRNAKSIMVCGGGPSAIEAVGDILSQFKGIKRIGLCVRGPRLLKRASQSMSDKTLKYLQDMGVEVHLNTQFDSFAMRNEYEQQVLCIGGKYHTNFMKLHFNDCLAPNGQIYVNQHFQINNSYPEKNRYYVSIAQNIFAFGDVCQTSLNEEKNVFSIQYLSDIIIQNILDINAGLNPSREIPLHITKYIESSMGPTMGISQKNGIVSMNPQISEQKHIKLNQWREILGGNLQLSLSQLNSLRFKKNLTFLFSKICCCLPGSDTY